MHEEYTGTQHQIDATSPMLSPAEKGALWQNIEARIEATPAPTPYHVLNFIPIRSMAPIAIVLIAVLGLGGTAAAAEQARPGDFLFPVDRALENARLAVTTSADARAELKARYADERLSELRSILDEAELVTASASATASTGTSSTIRTFSAEADVFADVTVVKVELNDQVTVFETTATKREEIVNEIVVRFGIDRGAVEAALDLEVEDRASRSEDRRSRVVKTEAETRVSAVLGTVTAFLNDDDLTAEARTELRTRLAAEVDGVVLQSTDRRLHVKTDDGRVKVEEKKNGRTKIEIRDGGYRIKIETDEEHTDVRTRLDNDFRDDDRDKDREDDDWFEERRERGSDDDDHGDDDDDRVDQRGNDDQLDDSTDRVRIEVRVDEGRAEVRAEYGDSKREFDTAYTTKAALIAEIAVRTGLAVAAVEAGLDIEVDD